MYHILERANNSPITTQYKILPIDYAQRSDEYHHKKNAYRNFEHNNCHTMRMLKVEKYGRYNKEFSVESNWLYWRKMV